MKLVAKSRGIKGYKSMFKERQNFDDERLKKIRKDLNELRHKFFKPKINEIRKRFYNIENPKNLFKSKIREIEENAFWLEKSFLKSKKYRGNDDIEYRRIRDIGNLFNQSTDEDYKAISTTSAFNNSCIEYESEGDENQNLSIKKYFNTIRPYLSNIIIKLTENKGSFT